MENKRFLIGALLIVVVIIIYINLLFRSYDSRFEKLEDRMMTIAGYIPVPNSIKRVEIGLLVRELPTSKLKKLDRTDYISLLRDGEILHYTLDSQAPSDTIITTLYYNPATTGYFRAMAMLTARSLNWSVSKMQSAITAISLFESGLNPKAASRKSTAKGLLQLTDGTMADCCASYKDNRLSPFDSATESDVTTAYWVWHCRKRVDKHDDIYRVYARHFHSGVLGNGLPANTQAYKKNPIDHDQNGKLDEKDIKVSLDTWSTFYTLMCNYDDQLDKLADCVVVEKGKASLISEFFKN